MFINERYDFVGISRNNLPGLDYVGVGFILGYWTDVSDYKHTGLR